MADNRRVALRSDTAPPVRALFSQGLRVGDLVQISGQGSIDPSTGDVLHLNDIEAQTATALDAIRWILHAGDSTFPDVVMMRVYLADRTLFAGMNRAYDAYMRANLGAVAPPARTTIIATLPLDGMLIEVDALAISRGLTARETEA